MMEEILVNGDWKKMLFLDRPFPIQNSGNHVCQNNIWNN
jgi:hypothetical protein